MKLLNSFKNNIYPANRDKFNEQALKLFRFQAEHNPIYAQYLANLSIDHQSITQLNKIPFLPIEFFKRHSIKTGSWNLEQLFLSSGTTGTVRSMHEIEDVRFYLDHARCLFEERFGTLDEMSIFALLPSYHEQGNSSLICMVEHLIGSSAADSGFYLGEYGELDRAITKTLSESRKAILFGVGYALLDFSDRVEKRFEGLSIIETGGMKGRREEMTKSWFYSILKEKLGNVQIYSEYGMTELLSQAYAGENFIFNCPKSMKVLIRDLQDPFEYVESNKSGGINVVDLANIHSCAFIETQDLGRDYGDGQFEILGRIDNSDIRGCNLMVD